MNFNFTPPNLDHLKNFKTIQQQLAEDNYASKFAEILLNQMNEFNNALGNDFELGICFANFGQVVQFPVIAIGYIDPSLIVFFGIDEKQNPMQLIQHVSQINFGLTSLKRNEPELPKREIGFRNCIE